MTINKADTEPGVIIPGKNADLYSFVQQMHKAGQGMTYRKALSSLSPHYFFPSGNNAPTRGLI